MEPTSIQDLPFPILLFDGHCNLCNGSVQFFLKNDRKKTIRFASLQSNLARQLLSQAQLTELIPTNQNVDNEAPGSMVYFYKGKVYTKSTGVLKALQQMGLPFSLLQIFLIVPKFIRDGFYRWVARNRYKWFGRKEECWLPNPSYQHRFLQ